MMKKKYKSPRKWFLLFSSLILLKELVFIPTTFGAIAFIFNMLCFTIYLWIDVLEKTRKNIQTEGN